jgi:hypothetical protein
MGGDCQGEGQRLLQGTRTTARAKAEEIRRMVDRGLTKQAIAPELEIALVS